MSKLRNKIILMFFVALAIILFNNKVFGFTIVLDPGHGGTDPGAIAENGEYEKDLNLKIAEYLKEYLSEYDVDLYMTHEGLSEGQYEVFDRAMFAREKNADLVLSLHLNGSESNANGAEVWVTGNTSLDKYNKNMTQLGNKILANFEELGIGNRGVKVSYRESDPTEIYSDGSKADYYGMICFCMRGCKIDYGVITPEGAEPAKVEEGEGVPAAIIEHCFLKGTDYQFIDSEEDLKKLAIADGQAVVEQYGLKKKKEIPFEDVSEQEWYYGAVKYNYENGMILGTSDTTFAPDSKLTRAMLVTILHRMEGQPYQSGTSKFPDVQDTSAYYYVAVKWATANNIVSGYDNGNFGPNDLITREQLAVMLNSYCKYKGEYKSTIADYSKYKDSDKISEFAKWGMNWAVGSKVITGTDEGYLNPQGNATRAEVAAMLYKYCMNVK